jgi:hypothetical protein
MHHIIVKQFSILLVTLYVISILIFAVLATP